MEQADAVKALLATSLGEGLSATEATALAAIATVKAIAKGAYLFRVGEAPSALFVVGQGELEVVAGHPSRGEVVVATLGAGQVVGELELMTRSARVASIMAVRDTRVLAFSAESLDGLLKRNDAGANKLVQNIARILARRLAAVNERLLHRPPDAPRDSEIEISADDLVVERDIAAAGGVWR